MNQNKNEKVLMQEIYQGASGEKISVNTDEEGYIMIHVTDHHKNSTKISIPLKDARVIGEKLIEHGTTLKVYRLNEDAVSEWFAAKDKEEALNIAEKNWGLDAFEEYGEPVETREEFIERFCIEEDLNQEFKLGDKWTTFAKILSVINQSGLICVESY